MDAMSKRIDCFAQDLYQAAGTFVTTNQLRKFLHCGRSVAEEIVSKLSPVYNSTQKKYYYRDIAELLAQGGN